jgi:hypothetical protein
VRSLTFAAAIAASVTCAAAQNQPTSSGTGFFVNTGGWLVTNRHVTDGCTRLEVKGYGDTTQVIRHSKNDLAVLRVKGGQRIAPVKLRDTPPKLGEEVVVLGYPLAGFLSDTIKITTGNINSLEGIRNDPLYLQVSAPIQPGNSGGPLIDRAGLVIGVNSATVSKELSDAIGFNVQNVNFSIRVDAVKDFLTDEGIAVDATDEDSPEISTAEIAAALQPSTVQVLCYGGNDTDSPSAATRQTDERPEAATRMTGAMRDAFGYDALGFDIGTVKNVTYDQCKRECASEKSCQAVTYNQRYEVCFLKTTALILVRNSDAASAYDTSLAADLVITDFSIYANKDAPGGDYMRLREADFVGCTVACMSDTQCRAFAYVRKTQDCWLKDRVGRARDMKGVEFGIK